MANRIGSFKDAAVELGITASAVSHRVTTLETLLGARLLYRNGTGIALTDAGRHYLASTEDALIQLQSAADIIRSYHGNLPLVVALYPTFAQRWLIPRLLDFSTQNPNLQIRLEFSQNPSRLVRTNADVAIEYREIDEAGWQSTRLINEHILPVCKPGYNMAGDAGYEVEALPKQTLLHCSFHPQEWQDWFKQASLSWPEHGHGHHMSTRDGVLTAAAAGLGVALAHSPLVDHDIAKGRLIAPFGVAHKTPNAYYLQTTEEKASFPRVIQFRQWLAEQLNLI